MCLRIRARLSSVEAAVCAVGAVSCAVGVQFSGVRVLGGSERFGVQQRRFCSARTLGFRQDVRRCLSENPSAVTTRLHVKTHKPDQNNLSDLTIAVQTLTDVLLTDLVFVRVKRAAPSLNVCCVSSSPHLKSAVFCWIFIHSLCVDGAIDVCVCHDRCLSASSTASCAGIRTHAAHPKRSVVPSLEQHGERTHQTSAP